jgi:hypothetical protein
MPIFCDIEIDVRRRPLRERLAFAQKVDRDRGVMAVRDRPDDVLRAERRIAAEEHVRPRGRHRLFVHDRHTVVVEHNADVTLDPRKRISCPDRRSARHHRERAPPVAGRV